MKKIIINGRFLIHKTTGVERYAREIIAELDEIVDKDKYELAVPRNIDRVPVYKNIKVVKVGKLKNVLWEHISLPLYVKKMSGISLNLCNVAPIIKPDVVCIHDMKIKAVPQYFSKKFLLWYNLLFFNETKRAKRILTVSEFSKSEIKKYYNVDDRRITVVSNAWQHFEEIWSTDYALTKYKLQSRNYYFAMGSLEPNKNLDWIINTAYNNKQSIFVIAGSINKKVFSEKVRNKYPDNIRLLGYVSDEEAKTLMHNCKAFLFPSFYEGFGIPPLEALSAGAPQVIVSDENVMHEILGESVVYINPTKPQKNLDSLLINNANTDEILKKYSWRESAQKIYNIMNEVENEK